MPSYELAGALTEMRNSPEPILHLVHPHSVPWSTIIRAFAHELHLPLVPYPEWLSTLQAKSQLPNDKPASEQEDEGEMDLEALRTNPALRLLSFFRSADMRPGLEAIGLARLEVRKALEASSTLEGIAQVGEENVRMWVAAWRASGFLPAEPVAADS